MTLPPHACLFTYDAISMYTNIDTTQCLNRLETYLTTPSTKEQFPHISTTALIEALHIVMHNNRMKFGDIFTHQHKGIAMGMAPAPSIANLFVGIYENTHIIPFPPTRLHFLRRFIDDGFGIWLRDPDQEQDNLAWKQFQDLVNNMGLTWDFSKRSNKVTFMDLVITLSPSGKIYTNIYAKPLALHLYIPPTSCHAPGVLNGLIFGHHYRIYHLCSHKQDIEREINTFLRRLLDRGHSLSQLLPLFLSAENKLRNHCHSTKCTHPQPHPPPPHPSTSPHNSNNSAFLHLQYHPTNPNTREIQQLWRTHVSTPPNKIPFHHLKNRDGYPIQLRRLTVAYSRAPNIGNLLSCRVLRAKIGESTNTPHRTQWEPTTTNEEHSHTTTQS
jgi:hypothetical protein